MFDCFLAFAKHFSDNYRIISTGNLTVSQISQAREEHRLFVDEYTHLGWVALHWKESAPKDVIREVRSY